MASIWHDSPSSPLLNSLGTHHTLARRGQWVCGWAHASSPWMQMTRRGIISSTLSLLSSLSKNGMFCLNIVLKWFSLEEILAFLEDCFWHEPGDSVTLSSLRRQCVSESWQYERWLPREPLNCWHRDIRRDWKLSFLLLPHGKESRWVRENGGTSFVPVKKAKRSKLPVSLERKSLVVAKEEKSREQLGSWG